MCGFFITAKLISGLEIELRCFLVWCDWLNCQWLLSQCKTSRIYCRLPLLSPNRQNICKHSKKEWNWFEIYLMKMVPNIVVCACGFWCEHVPTSLFIDPRTNQPPITNPHVCMDWCHFQSWKDNWMRRWFMVFDVPPYNNREVREYFIRKLWAEFVMGEHVNYFDIIKFEGHGLGFA